MQSCQFCFGPARVELAGSGKGDGDTLSYQKNRMALVSANRYRLAGREVDSQPPAWQAGRLPHYIVMLAEGGQSLLAKPYSHA